MSWVFNPFTNKLDKISIEDLSNYYNKAEVNALLWVAPPVDDWWDPTGGLPVAPEIGDRYIAEADGTGWEEDHIYEWDGTVWVESDPEDGWMIWMLFELIFYVFFSGGWVEIGSYSFLRLDTDNCPLTGELIITPTTGNTAIRANKDIILKSGQRLVFDG